MVKFKWVTSKPDQSAMVETCLQFFGVASVSAWRQQYVEQTNASAAYRASGLVPTSYESAGRARPRTGISRGGGGVGVAACSPLGRPWPPEGHKRNRTRQRQHLHPAGRPRMTDQSLPADKRPGAYPGGKRFAFSIVDDTDCGTVSYGPSSRI